jgi:hypothetical protein
MSAGSEERARVARSSNFAWGGLKVDERPSQGYLEDGGKMQRRLSSSKPAIAHRRRHRTASPARVVDLPADDTRFRIKHAVVGLATALAATIVVGSVLSLYELLVLGIRPWAEGPPQWSIYCGARSGIALVCSGLLLLGIERGAASGMARAGHVHLSLSAGEQATIGLLCGLALIFTGIFVYDPKIFFVLGSEDHVVESLSAAALFTAAACIAYALLRVRRNESTQLFTLGLLAAAFLLIALEEVSWFQRVFDLEPPPSLAANQQAELNLHNLHTSLSEFLFYGAGFVVLILLPYFCVITGRFDLVRGIPPGALGVFLIGASAPLAGYNYDMWNLFPIQVTFFATCLILARLVALTVPVSGLGAAAVLGLALFAVVVAQVTFLWFGSGFIRLWDVTEYKEFFIAAGCLCLAVRVLRSPLVR